MCMGLLCTLFSGLSPSDVVMQAIVLNRTIPEDILCPLVAGACIQICPKNPVNFSVDNVRVAKLLGASKTFRGMVLKVDTVVGSIKRIENAKVLVIARGVDTTATETSLIHKLFVFGPPVTVTNEQGGVATVLLGVGASTNIISDDQLERAVVNVVNTYRDDSRIVPGAGATEIEIARLREFSFKETCWKCQSLKNEDCKDASTLNIWDLYTTKQEPQSIFDRLMSALDFVKQTCQQDAKRNNEMAPILQSIMQDDEEFKRGWLGTKDVGDKIFGLSPHGKLYSFD
ncbi:T-complex protein 1 subunit theta [Tanacetum coccineum]